MKNPNVMALSFMLLILINKLSDWYYAVNLCKHL